MYFFLQVFRRIRHRPLPAMFVFLRTNTKAYPLGYLPALDGMRGLMILGVMILHSGYLAFSGAMVYMDIFFTMSGYLITSLLIADYKKYGSIRLKKFYLRRFLRLFPAFVTMLIVMVFISYFLLPDYKNRLHEIAVAFFYITDYFYFLVNGKLELNQHTWSLSIEEQFYVLWPLAFGLLLHRFGLSKTTATYIIACAGLFALSRIVMTYMEVSLIHLYYTFYSRADALLVGCALAVVLNIVQLKDYPRLSTILAHSLAPITFGAVVVALTMEKSMRWYYYVSPLFGALPAAIAICALVQPQQTLMHRFFEHPVPVYCGRICYGLYLWHWPIFVSLYLKFQLRGARVLLFGWPLAFACATASYYLIERHFMRVRPV